MTIAAAHNAGLTGLIEVEERLGPMHPEQARAYRAMGRIPHSLERGRMQFCAKHQRWYWRACDDCLEDTLKAFEEDAKTKKVEGCFGNS